MLKLQLSRPWVRSHHCRKQRLYSALGRADVYSCPPPHLKSNSTPPRSWTASNHISALFCLVPENRVSCGWRFPETHESQQIISHMNPQLFINEMPVSCLIACSVGKKEIWQLLLISQKSGWQTPSAQCRGGVQRRNKAA